MTITICGSISFMDRMEGLATPLTKQGFKEIFRPIGVGGHEKEFKESVTMQEDGQRKIDLDLINMHWHKILKCDCILVANYEKKGIPGYVGGNTFLEMGFAFVTGKPIFMLNPLPEMGYSSEMQGMQPIVINGDLRMIKEYYALAA
jgi:hypothetical protein